MPDHQHLWRGIHHPELVASGLAPQVAANADWVRFAITNTGGGHAFPTYAAPRAVMHAVAIDAAGAPRSETMRSTVIAPDVRYEGDHWIELSHTRLFPGQTVAIGLRWNASDRIQTWLEIIPTIFTRTKCFQVNSLRSRSVAQPADRF